MENKTELAMKRLFEDVFNSVFFQLDVALRAPTYNKVKELFWRKLTRFGTNQAFSHDVRKKMYRHGYVAINKEIKKDNVMQYVLNNACPSNEIKEECLNFIVSAIIATDKTSTHFRPLVSIFIDEALKKDMYWYCVEKSIEIPPYIQDILVDTSQSETEIYF